MASEIFTISRIAEKGSFFHLTALTIFPFLLWVNVTVSAAPPAPKISDERRTPLSEGLVDPSKEWRKPAEPEESQWRSNEPLTKQNEKKSRIESKRFKPYYYDPDKEGNTWDPYATDKNYGSKPATIFRFQF